MLIYEGMTNVLRSILHVREMSARRCISVMTYLTLQLRLRSAIDFIHGYVRHIDTKTHLFNAKLYAYYDRKYIAVLVVDFLKKCTLYSHRLNIKG